MVMKKGANETVEIEIKGLFDGIIKVALLLHKNFTKIP